MTKFKIGDVVRVINNDSENISSDVSIGEIVTIDENSTCPYFIRKNELYRGCGKEDCFELVEESNIKTNDGSCTSENKATNIMSKISEFVKSSLLSADEKLLRKYGLKSDCGEFTMEAQNLVITKLVKENENYLVEQAKALEVEEGKK